ncbi:hypothetical protein B0I33_101595 [Prauserella shujinwangii]|uniref:ScyD/ScyE family protein n=2 Tax=Prauserella shujinwangii TaxID=1453103 RepID=A0A2T0M3W3_9PSEU|nr:hypothetical protein B0I33_101595 [Prauserella shujinwangii]
MTSLVGLIVLLLAGAPTASAVSASAERVEVIAAGLDGPRGLTPLPGGGVLVAESGRGGAGPCVPVLGGFEGCLGTTGAVTMAACGGQRRIVTGLPSLYVADLQEALGPYDVALGPSGPVLVSVGFGGDVAVRPELGPVGAALGQVVRAWPDGRWAAFADIAGHRGPGAGSQPWGLHADGGRLHVTDAMTGSLHTVDRRGRIGTVPLEGTLRQPTTVVRGPDGAFYVGEFAFNDPGQARVLRLEPGAPVTVHATGFTHVSDLAFDAEGDLLVLEYAKNGVLSGDPTGRLTRIGADGSRTEIAAGLLENPTSVAAPGPGVLYVSNKGISIGAGEVLRVTTG